MSRLLPACLLLLSGSLSAAAQDANDHLAAFAKLAPELRHLNFVWAATTGDLNGDGIADVAMVLTGSKSADADREERLVVLAGRADGSYKMLSMSGEFCHPSKFYNLDIKKNSLFVAAVEYADAARLSSSTFQFRYDAQRDDLVLIGKEILGESYDDGSLERVSTNFLTGESVHTTREKGKTKSVKARAAKAALMPLNHTACDAFPG